MISVIGAGPAGSYVSYLLAKAGMNVSLFEEHKKIGEPFQCSGIQTNYFKDITLFKNDLVVNKIKKVRVILPGMTFLDFKLEKPNLVIDRVNFDKFLFDMAKSENVKTYLGKRFIGYKKRDKFSLKFNKGKFETDYLIGADGPLSSVAKSSGLFGKREFLLGMQARVKAEFDKDVFQVFLGNKICPGFFAWVIPENEKIARIGLATKKNTLHYFNKFVSKGKVLDKQAGLIPIYNPKIKSQKDNVFLVGDAATQVKASTAGGLVPGLISAKILANSILKGNNYDKAWKNQIGKDLYLSLLIRKTLNKFSDKDYHDLVKMLSKRKVKGLIEKYDREFPTKFLFKLALAEPRFLKYARRILV